MRLCGGDDGLVGMKCSRTFLQWCYRPSTGAPMMPRTFLGSGRRRGQTFESIGTLKARVTDELEREKHGPRVCLPVQRAVVTVEQGMHYQHTGTT